MKNNILTKSLFLLLLTVFLQHNYIKTMEIDQIVKHKQIDPQKKRFLCTICYISLTSKGNLNAHIKIHSGEKPYICTTCNNNFSRKGNLDTHQKKNKYTCTVCKENFCFKKDLIQHTHIHSTTKPYACSQCPKRYTHRSSLFSHIWTCHTDKKNIFTPAISIYQQIDPLFENELYQYGVS